MNTSDAKAVVRRYVFHSRQYLENGLSTLQKGEAGKAGELLWGSVAEALQATAAYMNKPVRTHRDLVNFAIQLGRDLKDESIQVDMATVQSLHHNFYDVTQEPLDVAIVVPIVQRLVAKLLGLIPPEAYTESASV